MLASVVERVNGRVLRAHGVSAKPRAASAASSLQRPPGVTPDSHLCKRLGIPPPLLRARPHADPWSADGISRPDSVRQG
jgi:hypothetical protein